MPFLRSMTLAAVLLAAASGAAVAQRNGDVSNGLDNQPTAGEVQSRERAAGVAPPASQQRARTGAVDDIYKQLMTNEKPGAAGSGQPAVAPLQPGAAPAK